MDKINVLQITHDLHIGGLQRVVVDLAKGLDRSKYSVSVCALRDGGPLEKELIEAGIKVIRFPFRGGRPDYLQMLKLFKLMKLLKPSVVHTHNTHPLTDGVPAAVLAGVPVKVHTDHARKFPDKRRYMFAEWILSHFVTEFVAVTEQTKCELVRHERIPQGKIKVVQNGIMGAKYSVPLDKIRKRSELGIRDGSAPILGVVARLIAQKGIACLLEATRLLREQFPGVLLLVAGEGELWEELNDQAERWGLGPNVIFLGARHDVHEILQLVDIFVLPSHSEGLPLVLLEAAAAALPIVATDVGGIRQIVHESINGFLVKPKDVRQLYDAIKRLCEDRSLRETFSKNSRKVFQTQFDLGVMIKNYEALYLSGLRAAGLES